MDVVDELGRTTYSGPGHVPLGQANYPTVRLAVCEQEHGHEGNPARVYGYHGSPRTCIRVKETGQWAYDPAWERADQPPRLPVQPPPPPHQPYA